LEVTLKEFNSGSVPHSNQPVAARPFGLTDPFTMAPFAVTEVAVPVATTGGRPADGTIADIRGANR
jgi:hypothetical protein